jgi:Tol biopolymer transport system component
MDGSTSISQAVIGNADPSWKIAGTGDFNRDGKSDLLWRNDDGSVALWQTDGLRSLTSYPVVDNSWKIAGTGDFNGDGKSDILWRNDNGQVAVWTMNGATALSRNLTSPDSIVDNSWKITGTGDFSSDGKADILWRNDNGSVAIWQMDGSMVTSTSLTSTPLVDNSWKIAAPIL